MWSSSASALQRRCESPPRRAPFGTGRYAGRLCPCPRGNCGALLVDRLVRSSWVICITTSHRFASAANTSARASALLCGSAGPGLLVFVGARTGSVGRTIRGQNHRDVGAVP